MEPDTEEERRMKAIVEWGYAALFQHWPRHTRAREAVLARRRQRGARAGVFFAMGAALSSEPGAPRRPHR